MLRNKIFANNIDMIKVKGTMSKWPVQNLKHIEKHETHKITRTLIRHL